MRATFTKLIYILPIVLAFISVNLMGQTKAQLDEIKSYEQKIEMNKDNPHFDVETAKIQLSALKQQYGIKTNTEAGKNASSSAKESNNSPFAAASGAKGELKSNRNATTNEAVSSVVYPVNAQLLANMPEEIMNFVKSNPQNFKIIDVPTKSAADFKNITISKEQFNSIPKDVQTLILKYPDFIKIAN